MFGDLADVSDVDSCPSVTRNQSPIQRGILRALKLGKFRRATVAWGIRLSISTPVTKLSAKISAPITIIGPADFPMISNDLRQGKVMRYWLSG